MCLGKCCRYAQLYVLGTNAIGTLNNKCFGPTPSCMQRTKPQQNCVATLQYNHVACGTCSMLQRSSVSAPSSSAECACSAAQYLSQLVASLLLPVYPCNRSLAYPAGLLLCHQSSKVDNTDWNWTRSLACQAGLLLCHQNYQVDKTDGSSQSQNVYFTSETSSPQWMNLNRETSRDSTIAFLHCGDVLGTEQEACLCAQLC